MRLLPLDASGHIDWGLVFAEFYSDDGDGWAALQFNDYDDGPAIKLQFVNDEGQKFGIEASLTNNDINRLREALDAIEEAEPA